MFFQACHYLLCTLAIFSVTQQLFFPSADVASSGQSSQPPDVDHLVPSIGMLDPQQLQDYNYRSTTSGESDQESAERIRKMAKTKHKQLRVKKLNSLCSPSELKQTPLAHSGNAITTDNTEKSIKQEPGSSEMHNTENVLNVTVKTKSNT